MFDPYSFKMKFFQSFIVTILYSLLVFTTKYFAKSKIESYTCKSLSEIKGKNLENFHFHISLNTPLVVWLTTFYDPESVGHTHINWVDGTLQFRCVRLVFLQILWLFFLTYSFCGSNTVQKVYIRSRINDLIKTNYTVKKTI